MKTSEGHTYCVCLMDFEVLEADIFLVTFSLMWQSGKCFLSLYGSSEQDDKNKFCLKENNYHNKVLNSTDRTQVQQAKQELLSL